MRVRTEEYARALQRGIAPFHVFYGDELLPLLECEDALRSAARAQGFSERVNI